MDQWATEVGDESYTFERLLPFYKAGITYSPPDENILTNITATPDPPRAFSSDPTGPLQVSYDNVNDAFNSWSQKSLQQSGMRNIAGFNDGDLIGSGSMTFTIDPSTATRSSSESSYLQSALRNTTLKVYKNTMAEKLVFNGTTVTGVSVSAGGRTWTISARNEVIVCAGAFQSPQILMVSGIGPRAALQDFKIPVIKDLPGVGQNLQDQPYWGISYRVKMETASSLMNDPAAAAAAQRLYKASATGPLAVSAGGVFGWEKFPQSYRSQFTAATRAALAKFPSDWPELEWLPVSAFLGTQANHQTSDPEDGYNYATIAASLIAPLSRGSVYLASNSMNDPPNINPNWLSDPADQEMAIAAVRRQREMWGILTKYNLTIGPEYYPGADVQTDAQILDAISKMVTPIWHAASTCKMGNTSDPMAVIDSQARVYGVKGLRVVDASSFPFLPPGHPQATIYALAQKIAAEILQEIRPRPEPYTAGPIFPAST